MNNTYTHSPAVRKLYDIHRQTQITHRLFCSPGIGPTQRSTQRSCIYVGPQYGNRWATEAVNIHRVDNTT